MATSQINLSVPNLPPGFVRAGGKRLPLKHRDAACREIAEATRGEDNPVRVHVTTERIVKKYERISRKDATQLFYGRTSVPVYEDPDAASKARRMLLHIPSTAEFAGSLNDEEFRAWVLWISDLSDQTEIARVLDKTQGAVSKMLKRAANKLNARYLELRDADKLPLVVMAWVKATAGGIPDPCLDDAIRNLRRRDRARKAGREESTGCPELDELSIRDTRQRRS